MIEKPKFDPGLTQQVEGKLRRMIDKDGMFNVRRRGTTWRDVHPYLKLINMRWPGFLAIVVGAYIVVNVLFAIAYYAVGTEQLQGAEAPTAWGRFLNVFFFSAQTLSTVGYGSIAPKGTGAQILSALEAMIGLMGFALATGLLFGRVARPSAKIGFSQSIIIAPYRDGTSLQFRIVNQRPNKLMEIEAQVLLMTVEGLADLRRSYKLLQLERDNVIFFPLTWTVVHPIGEDSPLWGKTAADLEQMQAEFLIQIKGYDDTFSQTVRVLYSYRYDEIVWGARFAPAFHVDSEGDLVLDVHKVGELAATQISGR